jgi:hypothetical protein
LENALTADVDGDGILDKGAWGIFVARTVQEIRSEVGEGAANRVAAALHAQKSEAIEATREQQKATEVMLARALEQVAEARRAHERLQADLARMQAALRSAKEDAAVVRADADDLKSDRRSRRR